MKAASSVPDPDRLADDLADQVFRRIDRNGDGSLSVEEVIHALADLGLSESQQQQQCARMMQSGRPMDRQAFLSFCHDRVRRMHDLFLEIDTNRTNEISDENIRAALRRVGLEADRVKIRRLIAMVDQDGDNRITFNEFYSALLLLPSSSVADLFHNWDRASLCDLGETSAMIPQQSSPALNLANAPSSLIAGGVAGIVSRTVTAPFDRLKLILQADGSPLTSRVSLVDSFRRIYREGGVRGLFRGNLANVIKVCPENAIKMWAFHTLGGFSMDESRSVLEQFMVGATAGAISQTVIYPMETIKTHFALSRAGQYLSLASCAACIYQKSGVLGFYRGLTAATFGIIPYAGVDLSLFAFFRRTWEERYPHHNPSALQLLGFGALSSTCGQLVAYPFQLIRTRLQSQGMPNRPIVYDGVLDCFRKTVKQDGLLGLYRGLKPNFIKALPSISISYMVYDMMFTYLEADHQC